MGRNDLIGTFYTHRSSPFHLFLLLPLPNPWLPFTDDQINNKAKLTTTSSVAPRRLIASTQEGSNNYWYYYIINYFSNWGKFGTVFVSSVIAIDLYRASVHPISIFIEEQNKCSMSFILLIIFHKSRLKATMLDYEIVIIVCVYIYGIYVCVWLPYK